MNFVEELRWRGMIHDIMPGTEEQLDKEMTCGYIGFDPTADSMHIGNLVQLILLKHFQLKGHKPFALVGGATGMVGDPSGKSEERKFLDEERLLHNLNCQKKQIEKFLDFSEGPNKAEILNNYDWFKDINMLSFLRDVGKHITISYMMSKDSVQKRLETGISFTEFSYQLIQGYDFYYLNDHKKVKLQMGGSDQWGNIVTGTELIRRKSGREAFALTCPLITKSDGGKFGKSEQGNVWLDPEKTSPYAFYQFWLNTSDEDAKRYIRIFTFRDQNDILRLEKEHAEAPHLRVLQKTLAEDITIMVHSKADLETAIAASDILFGKGTTESLKKLSEKDLLGVFEGVPMFEIKSNDLASGISLLDLLTEKSSVFPSKGEARKMIQAGGVSLNKSKFEDPNHLIKSINLINEHYILAQKGKKQYFLFIAR